MTGLLDVGGGMKCAFSAGIYDCFMKNGVTFDYCLGVSAGTMNLLSYIAGERGRMIDLYCSAAESDEYLSLAALINDGSYMNYNSLRKDYFTEDEGKFPFDFAAYRDSPAEFAVAVTRAADAEPVYFRKEEMGSSVIDYMSASCCLPIASKPILIDGVEYYDGGIAEPIPYAKAFEDGCDRLVVVLSSPAAEKASKVRGAGLMSAYLNDYPAIGDAIETRHVIYNYCVRHLRKYEREGKVIILAPEDLHGATTLIKDVKVISGLYNAGYQMAEQRLEDIRSLIS